MNDYNGSINLNYTAKNKLIKNVTIDEPAEIINKGFDGQMEYMGKRFDKIDSEMKEIKTDLKENIKQTDKLEMRVDYVENILAIPPKKP